MSSRKWTFIVEAATAELTIGNEPIGFYVPGMIVKLLDSGEWFVARTDLGTSTIYLRRNPSVPLNFAPEKFVPVINSTDNLYPDNPLPDRILACTDCGTVVFTRLKDKHICPVKP